MGTPGKGENIFGILPSLPVTPQSSQTSKQFPTNLCYLGRIISDASNDDSRGGNFHLIDIGSENKLAEIRSTVVVRPVGVKKPGMEKH